MLLSAPHPSLRRLRVLVVEDDPAYRDLAREALAGHERWFAATAQEGLELFQSKQPDVVFLDIGLPDDSGLQAMLSMREQVPGIFVVILSASRLGEDVALAQRCAVNGYVSKPFSRKQLQVYCEACVRHQEKLEDMPPQEREAFERHIRAETKRMQSMLHAPTPKAQAALQQLLPQWNILLVRGPNGDAGQWCEALRRAGCNPVLAATGAEALEKGRSHDFRLLITEDTLEDMDASELLYRLRVNHQEIPALVVADAEWKRHQDKWRKVAASSRIVAGPLDDHSLRTLVEREVARNLHEAEEIVLKM